MIINKKTSLLSKFFKEKLYIKEIFLIPFAFVILIISSILYFGSFKHEITIDKKTYFSTSIWSTTVSTEGESPCIRFDSSEGKKVICGKNITYKTISK